MARAVLLASLIMITSIVGGCVEDEPKAGTASDATSSPGTAAASETAGGLVNTPPVPLIQVLSNGTALVPENGSVAAPAGENLTFDASGSTDAEGDALAYAWDFGGAATSTEATATHAFAEPGNYTVTLTVTDVGGQASTANVTLVVAAAGLPPGTWLRDDAQSFGNVPAETAVANGCGKTYSKDWILVDLEANGTASTAIKVVVSLASSGGSGANGYSRLAFLDPSGKVLKENKSGTSAKSITIDGPLPAGKYKVEAAHCATYLFVDTGTPAVSGVATYVSV